MRDPFCYTMLVRLSKTISQVNYSLRDSVLCPFNYEEIVNYNYLLT